MSVASIELCRELYELSGWEYSDYYWCQQEEGGEFYDLPIEDIRELREYADSLPAYDLGYLLRKLPYMHMGYGDAKMYLSIEKIGDGAFRASYDCKNGCPRPIWFINDNPEDAACRLAIELFKQGILKRED